MARGDEDHESEAVIKLEGCAGSWSGVSPFGHKGVHQDLSAAREQGKGVAGPVSRPRWVSFASLHSTCL